MKTNSKLYLKIIGLLLILLPFADLVVNGHYSDFERGYNEGNSKESYVYFSVVPNSDKTSTIQIPNINGDITASKIDLEVHTDKSLNIYPFYIWVLYMLAAFAFIFYLVSIIRLVKRFIKGQLFEKSTYNTLLYNGFSLIAFTLIDSSLNFIKNYQLEKYIQNSNYTLATDNMIDISSIITGLIILAFAVALKQSLDIKEENDLTI
ncbi:DUF2975 domain-containing protein [Empedobacter sedimenti]|uniref:DUF2975 domain-containing protein n=1 Tax=Empedobacter sedimenti TaxID=3042610 RepID=UPI0024A61F30|nr:DUF2975 domain-containing protein [Empedobacter sedimenti]